MPPYGCVTKPRPTQALAPGARDQEPQTRPLLFLKFLLCPLIRVLHGSQNVVTTVKNG